MPVRRRLVLAVIAACFGAALLLATVYGPSRRVRVSPPAVVEVSDPAGLLEALERSGVRGRIAIVFARYLNALEGRDDRSPPAIEIATERDIARHVLHLPPDGAWEQIARTLGARNDMRPTAKGFDWLAGDVRFEIAPFSRFAPPGEEAIVVVEPLAWSASELGAIVDGIRRRAPAADLVLVVRGTPEVAESFRRALAAAPR